MEPGRKRLSSSEVSGATGPLTPANIWRVSGRLFAAGPSGLAPVKLLVLDPNTNMFVVGHRRFSVFL